MASTDILDLVEKLCGAVSAPTTSLDITGFIERLKEDDVMVDRFIGRYRKARSILRAAPLFVGEGAAKLNDDLGNALAEGDEGLWTVFHTLVISQLSSVGAEESRADAKKNAAILRRLIASVEADQKEKEEREEAPAPASLTNDPELDKVLNAVLDNLGSKQSIEPMDIMNVAKEVAGKVGDLSSLNPMRLMMSLQSIMANPQQLADKLQQSGKKLPEPSEAMKKMASGNFAGNPMMAAAMMMASGGAGGGLGGLLGAGPSAPQPALSPEELDERLKYFNSLQI